MEIKINNTPWNPSDNKSIWKPKKLGRYSLSENKIQLVDTYDYNVINGILYPVTENSYVASQKIYLSSGQSIIRCSFNFNDYVDLAILFYDSSDNYLGYNNTGIILENSAYCVIGLGNNHFTSDMYYFDTSEKTINITEEYGSIWKEKIVTLGFDLINNEQNEKIASIKYLSIESLPQIPNIISYINQGYNKIRFIPVSGIKFRWVACQGFDFPNTTIIYSDWIQNILQKDIKEYNSSFNTFGYTFVFEKIDESSVSGESQNVEDWINIELIKTEQSKNTFPLDIVENKEGALIYKDLNFEVFVKTEAEVKNFVDAFDLSSFQEDFENNLLLKCHNSDYYGYRNFEGNYNYHVGEAVKGIYTTLQEGDVFFYLFCIEEHTSSANFNTEWSTNRKKWIEAPNQIKGEDDWLFIEKNINENNYKSNFPYVASLLFKNLWRCDVSFYLKTYIKKAVLTSIFNSSFAKNLREINPFFDKGYFDNADNYSNVENFGIRLLRGESFLNDEILGNINQDNYFDFIEDKHNIPTNWNPLTDQTNTYYFKGELNNPFDHYYRFEPKKSIPFFKEKIFEDFQIECNLQRNDKLGNIYKRIIQLPIYINFYNNLIKCYESYGNINLGADFIRFYNKEYINSNEIHNRWFTNENQRNNYIVIWCPNIEKISFTITVIGTKYHLIENEEGFIKKNGQLGLFHWWYYTPEDGNRNIETIINFEYSDGENYDSYTYIRNDYFTSN